MINENTFLNLLKFTVLILLFTSLLLSNSRAADVLFILDPFEDAVLHRFDGSSGAFLGEFTSITAINGTNFATDIVLGEDNLLYVGSGGIGTTTPGHTNDVLRFNPANGTFVDTFVAPGSGGLTNSSGPRLTFDSGNNLYITSENTNEVLKYDADTGTFIGAFVSAGAGGLDKPRDLQFNSNGDLLVLTSAQGPLPGSTKKSEVLRFDGINGTFQGIHIIGGSGGLTAANEMAIGPDGNLYISDFFNNEILRYDGNTGEFIDVFVESGSGGLVSPRDLAFGSDGNLYVGAGGNIGTVLRYDGQTGEFIDDFVPSGSGGLNNPVGLAFAQVDSIDLDNISGTNLLLGQAGDISIINVPFSGNGGLQIVDSSTVVLQGDNTYTGDTIVGSSTLIVNGSITSSAILTDSGVIGGSGVLGNVTLQQATLAPGNSIGTITLNGDLTLNSNSIYEVELNAAGNTDLTIVNGSVALGGATLSILAENGDYQLLTSYLIIDNDGNDAIVNEFGDIDINLLFLSPFISTTGGDGNDVELTLLRNDIPFTDAATTPNQIATAATLDVRKTAQNGNLDSLVSSLVTLNSSQATTALDSLSGELHASTNQGIQLGNRSIIQFISNRLRKSHSKFSSSSFSFNSVQPVLLASAGDDINIGHSNKSNNNYEGWVSGIAGFGDIDSDSNAASIDYEYYGLISGVDFFLNDYLTFGASFSYLDHETTINRRADESKADSYSASIYANWRNERFYLLGLFGFSLDSYESSRRIFLGSQIQSLDADYDGNQFFGSIESGVQTKFQSIKSEPYIGLDFLRISRDSFTENGNSLARLIMEDADHDIVISKIGIRLSNEFKSKGMNFIPELDLGWRHSLTPTKDKINTRFINTTNFFTVAGIETSRDSLEISTRINFLTKSNLGGFIGYRGSYSADQRSHAFHGSLHISW